MLFREAATAVKFVTISKPFRLMRKKEAAKIKIYAATNTLVAVSYTHLDVYKRQMLEDDGCAAGLLLAEMGLSLTEAVRECRQPVSYTHLDVYKRQVQTMSVSFTVWICSLIRPSSSMMVPFGSTSMGRSL